MGWTALTPARSWRKQLSSQFALVSASSSLFHSFPLDIVLLYVSQHRSGTRFFGNPPKMPTGVVRNWFDDEGFGFIIPGQDIVDVFVHRHGLENVKKLSTCDTVTFAYAYNEIKKGWIAVEVMVCDAVDMRQVTRQRLGRFCLPTVRMNNASDFYHARAPVCIKRC